LTDFLLTLLWVIFTVDSILLVLIVLLQSGRGGGLSGMLGGGGMAESALGPKSGLPRITGIMAGIFFIAAILIGLLTRPSEIGERKKTKGDKSKPEPAATAEPETKDKPTTATPKAATSLAPAPKATTATPPAPKPATSVAPAPKAATSVVPAPKAAPGTPTPPGTKP